MHGGRRGPCTISIGLQKAQGVRKRIKKNRSNLVDKRSTLTSLKQSSMQLWSLKAASSPVSGMGVTVARVCATARILARFCMHHADVDMRVWRAPCVSPGSLLLFISSIHAAETQLELAFHRPRARIAARRVVGDAQASPFASQMYSVCCSRWSVAALSELERCVKPVSVMMGVYRCVPDVCSASDSRGPVRYRRRAINDILLHSTRRRTQKREKVGRPGLQHVRGEWSGVCVLRFVSTLRVVGVSIAQCAFS